MRTASKTPLTATAKSWWTDSLFILAVGFIFFFAFLGDRPLFTPDEGRYAEIAREMVTRNDYVTPYLNGIKYFEKPAFFYWLGVIAIKLGVVNIWAVRSINALIGLVGLLITYLATRKLFDRLTGLLAASILGTSMLYFVMSHMVSLDLPVTVFLSACLYSFIIGTREASLSKSCAYFYTSAFFAGLAVLTKGLIGIVFPIIIIGAWILTTNRFGTLKKFPFIGAIILFLFVTVPWHWLVATRNPEFFYFYFIEQHFLRYTTLDIGHYQPAWYFFPVLLAGFFPWIVFLPQAFLQSVKHIFQKQDKDGISLYFLLWAALVFTFFSFSKSKLIPYILPTIPPLAILSADYLAKHLRKSRKITGLLISELILLCSSAVISFYLIQFARTSALPDALSAKLYLTSASIVLIAGVSSSIIMLFRNKHFSIFTLTISTAIFLILSMASIRAIDTRTVLPLAIKIKSLAKPGDEVISYNQYYQDLPFYLQKRITILNWRNEMSYGMKYQDTHDWMINDDTFWRRWHSQKRLFVIMGLEEFKQFQKKYSGVKWYIIAKTENNILISNHP